jgi:hypothetical protein
MSTQTNFYDSCEKADFNAAEFYIKIGAVIDEMAMKLATKTGDSEIIKFLIQKGGNVTPDCLTIAAKYNKPDIVVFYKSLGVADVYGEAYETAVRSRFQKCAELLFNGKIIGDSH